MKKGQDYFTSERVNLTIASNPSEYMALTDTFSPILHRLDQAVRWRAVHPNEPVPPPYEILTRYSKPPDELAAKSQRKLEKLVAAADVKKGKSITGFSKSYGLPIYCESSPEGSRS